MILQDLLRQVLLKLGHVVMLLINLKDKLFSCISVILSVVQNEWLATDSQNAILNNFEEYYNKFVNS